MSSNRAILTTNQTAPPPGSMRMLTASDPYVMTEVVEKSAKDWSKIEAYSHGVTYTQGSFAIGTTIRPSPIRIIADTCILTHMDTDHIRTILYTGNLHRHLTAYANTFQAGQCKNLVMLSKESNMTTHADLFTFASYNAHADLKAHNIIQMYADLLEKVADPLKGYEKYQAANWDGHGAEAITAATLDYARKLFKALPTTLGSPDVAPAGDGSIALEWVPDHHHKLSKLFLDIGPGEEWCAYWKLHDGHFDTVTHEGFHPTTTKAVLKDLFDHLSK
ncbi:hypothetical protein [Bradyrhizobium sp. LB13.1]